MSFNNTRIPLNQAVFLVLLFLVARLGLLTLLNFLSDGKELASDVVFHDLIISQPFAILQGTAKHIASYPAFQWVIEMPLFRLYNNFFTEMISYRLLMITVESLSFLLLIYLCNLAIPNKLIALAVLLLFILSPHQYFASVLLVQEDVISQLFSLLAVIFLLTGKRLLAIAVLSVGVITAKIFFVIPLFYIVMFEGRHLLKSRLLLGTAAILPIAFVYFIAISNALTNGGEVPIRDFTPDAAYAANYWVLLLQAYPDSLPQIKNISLLITVAIQLILIAVLYALYTKDKRPINPAVLIALPLGFFLGTFYQHLPEYLLIFWPLMALLYKSVIQQLLVAAAISFAWVPKIFHGLMNIGANGTAAEARVDIIAPLLNYVSINAASLHKLALVANTLVFAILLFSLTIRSFQELRAIDMKQL